jgi:hypothetical protein
MSRFRTPQVILFSGDLSRAVDFYTRLGFRSRSSNPVTAASHYTVEILIRNILW